jgi:hypothetical protein
MIFNSIAIIDLFVSGLRWSLALALIVGGWRAWMCRPADAESRAAHQARLYLLGLTAVVLLLLNVVSWPLFYVLLHSYIPQWPGVMCIHGVTQIGRDSISASRFLPGLVAAIEVLRPIVLFTAGAWLLCYLVNRRAATAPRTRGVLAALLVMASFALVDATAEAAYLVIPKVEKHLSVGCCSAANAISDSASLATGQGDRHATTAVAIGLVVATTLATGASLLLSDRFRSTIALGLLALAGGASLFIGAGFLREVAAPWLLGLPHHQCAYCMFARTPESIVTALLLMLGAFLLGWAAVVGLVGHAETRRHIVGLRRSLLQGSFWCFLGFLGMLSLELWLARQ